MKPNKKYLSILTNGYEDYWYDLKVNDIHGFCSIDNGFKTIEIKQDDLNKILRISNKSNVKVLFIADTSMDAKRQRQNYYSNLN